MASYDPRSGSFIVTSSTNFTVISSSTSVSVGSASRTSAGAGIGARSDSIVPAGADGSLVLASGSVSFSESIFNFRAGKCLCSHSSA